MILMETPLLDSCGPFLRKSTPETIPHNCLIRLADDLGVRKLLLGTSLSLPGVSLSSPISEEAPCLLLKISGENASIEVHTSACGDDARVH